MRILILALLGLMSIAACDKFRGEPGTPGAPGYNSLVKLVQLDPSPVCNAGGVSMSSGLDLNRNGQLEVSEAQFTQAVCNGEAGVMGPQGPTGQAGTPGSTVIFVKLCADDTSEFPEYALKITNGSTSALFAVYWGDTPGSPGNQSQAFGALITPRSYRSTGGNGCAFTVNPDLSITLN